MTGIFRKNCCLLLLLLPLLLLSACGRQAAEARGTPAEIADAVAASQTELPELWTLQSGSDAFAHYMDQYYHLPPSSVTDGEIRYPSGAGASEIAILRFRDAATAEAARELLGAYVRSRTSDFIGYAPEQAAIAGQGRAAARGDWAALLILPDPEAAEAAFLACFGETELPAATPEPTSEPTPQPTPDPTSTPAPTPVPDVYDHDAVLAAWRGGDGSALAPKNRAVLEAARGALAEALTEDMSDYEKELAVHDWMLAHGRYDTDHMSHAPGGAEQPDNENPYGFFTQGKGVCYGYASTFQLLMDMTGIECITVKGVSGTERAAHAWNMVRLDGDWYFVDVTWDDPISSYPLSAAQMHKYFNVTSDFIRGERHYWDEDAYPAATAVAWAWMG